MRLTEAIIWIARAMSRPQMSTRRTNRRRARRAGKNIYDEAQCVYRMGNQSNVKVGDMFSVSSARTSRRAARKDNLVSTSEIGGSSYHVQAEKSGGVGSPAIISTRRLLKPNRFAPARFRKRPRGRFRVLRASYGRILWRVTVANARTRAMFILIGNRRQSAVGDYVDALCCRPRKFLSTTKTKRSERATAVLKANVSRREIVHKPRANPRSQRASSRPKTPNKVGKSLRKRRRTRDLTLRKNGARYTRQEQKFTRRRVQMRKNMKKAWH